jgi:hypothetical protein
MNETRVNLKHLLEDIRDSYSSPLEEVILTELVANALDSKAVHIRFDINREKKYIRCTDDGIGMKRSQLKNYHNIASSTKVRGQGIGFAGIGAKLSLLLAEKVVTESRGGHGSQCATEWLLANPYRALWKFVPFSGTIARGRGTSVTIYFGDDQTHLLKPEFVEEAIVHHFYPLLSEKFYNQFLKYFYKVPVDFIVNGRSILLPEAGQEEYQHWFQVTVGKISSRAGIGFLVKTGERIGWLQKMLGTEAATSSLSSGLWISTFGKVIKGGWEWVGILPKNSSQLSGLVEVPGLSEILTTNKNDFLSDANSLKKYYKYRKAIQEAVLPILKDLGEDQATASASPEKMLKPLHKTITGALNSLVDDFPELESLIGSKRAQALGKMSKEENQSDLVTVKKNPQGSQTTEQNPENLPKDGSADSEKSYIPKGIADQSKNRVVKAKTTGLKLLLAEISDSIDMPLGRIMEDTLTVNTAHPAWRKAKTKGLEEYHILVTVASTLSQFLESEKDPQEFLKRLLLAWATENKQENKEKLF